jgi:hypothetical protein
MQNNALFNLSMALCLMAISPAGFAQGLPTIAIGSEADRAPTQTEEEAARITQNSLGQAPVGPVDCEAKFPFPPTIARDPYSENGQEICRKLQIRGQRMQCEVDSLLSEKPDGKSTVGSKIEMAAWARCNLRVASLLVEGYYLPASEIERRLQICSANFYSDPAKLPMLGWYQRFLRWAASNDLTPPPTDAALEVALKQSTPLESHQDAAGLMKCDWMFSRSKKPVIDVLPGSGGGSAGAAAAPAGSPNKKAAPKRVAP